MEISTSKMYEKSAADLADETETSEGARSEDEAVVSEGARYEGEAVDRDDITLASTASMRPTSTSIVQGISKQRGNGKVTGNGDGNRPDRSVLRPADYELIVQYLEIPENFQALHGSGGKTKVGKKYQSKSTSYGVMAVQLMSQGFPSVTGKTLYKKCLRYLQRYQAAANLLKQTGGGLTDEEISRGMSLDDKVNKACPFFHRMDALFGRRANVEPPALCSLGLPSPRVQTDREEQSPEKARSTENEPVPSPEVEEFDQVIDDNVFSSENITFSGVGDLCDRSLGADAEVNTNLNAEETEQNMDDVNLSAAASATLTREKEVQLPQQDYLRKNPGSVRSREEIRRGSTVKVKSNWQSTIQESLAKKEEFRKSILEVRFALLDEQRKAAEIEREDKRRQLEHEREDRKRSLEEEKEERRLVRKETAEAALFVELSKSGRSIAEVKELMEFFFQQQTTSDRVSSQRVSDA